MDLRLAAVIVSGLLVCSAAAARADAPYRFDTTFGRLPKTVVPLDYDIGLKPDLAARTTSGVESVRIRVRSATAKIVFNTLEMTVSKASLSNGATATIATDNQAQQTSLAFGHALAPGVYTLRLAFAGKIGTAPQGLFVQPYTTASGAHEEMLATQLESTDARRVFPSWDEPAFRATYHLTATVPQDFTAVSNMPIEHVTAGIASKTVTFARTPSMSTYLVVFCAGKLARIGTTVDGVKVGVLAPPDRIENGRYALDAAAKLLAYYDRYYDYTFPLPKLDLIDVPGGFPGAMENWGGITFAEGLLMHDPKTEPESQKEDIFQTVAHEMSHQWTGDLVTMDWWSGIWLNESFADWMQTKATDHFNPSWHMWDRIGADVTFAMTADQQSTSHPIIVPVKDETQAATAFDEITYQKGGAVIRMFEHYLGEDTFRDGVRAYVRAHAYSNSTAADLFAGLSSAAHRDVGALVEPWIATPGVPLVDVTATCANGKRTLSLSQQRFLVESGQTSEQVWSIPVAIGVGPNVNYVLLASKTATADGGSCDQPFVVNDDALGYYRLKLDDPSEAAQIAHLSDMKVSERARLIDDGYALTLAGDQAPAQLFAALAQLRPDDALAVWLSTARALGGIADLEAGRPGLGAFDAYIVRLLDPVLAHVGWDLRPDDGPQSPELRTRLIESLGFAGDKAVIAEAQRRFAGFIADPASLPPALTGPVAAVAGTYADQTTWDELHKLFADTRDRTVAGQYGTGLWSARDSNLASKNLNMAIDGEITTEDGVAAPYFDLITVALRGRHPDTAWAFFKGNQDRLSANLPGFVKPVVLGIVAPLFWNAAPVTELDALIDGAQGVPPEQKARTKHTIDVKLAERSQVIPPIDTWIAANAPGQPAGAAPAAAR
jgi:aminopeptidase N